MNKRVSFSLIVLASLGACWMGIAAYFSLSGHDGETSAQVVPDVVESPGRKVREAGNAGNQGSNPFTPLQSAPNDTSPQVDEPTKPVPNPHGDDAPETEAVVPRYQKKMQLGATSASLFRDTPLEWLRQYLKSVPSIDLLGVAPDALTPEVIDILAESGNIEGISVGAVHLLSDEAAKALPRLTGVRGLSISTNLPYRSNSGPVEEELNPFIESFLAMPDVTALSIGGTINDELLRSVSELGQLLTLRLDNYNDLRRHDKITTAGILHLSRLSGLKELVMINFTVGRHRIDLDRLADLLSGFSGLDRLSLSGWWVTDTHLAPCSSVLCRLSHLDLSNTGITDGFYRTIDATWMLEDLSAPGIGDEGLQALASAPNLKRLSAGERVTDVGIRSLAENAHGLEALNIGHAAITDDSLNALHKCQSLKELGVRFTAGITATGLKQLCEALELEILDTSGNKFVTSLFVEELLSVSPSLKTLIHYPFSILTNGDRQKLMSDFPGLTIAPAPLTGEWYR